MAHLRRGWTCWLALLSASWVLPAPLAAHGGDSSIARVAALDDEHAPWLLQLSEGLALRREDGWQFVCPAAFEASTVLHALSHDPRSAWVVTLRGSYRLSRDGGIERASEPCRGHPLGLVRHREQTYLLAEDASRTEHVVCVLEEHGAREVYASATPLADLASDGERLWLVQLTPAADGGGLAVAALGDGDRPGPWQRHSLAQTPRAVRVVAARGALYATLIDAGRRSVVRLAAQRAELLLENVIQLSGPVQTESGVFALADGVLISLHTPLPANVETPFDIDGLDGIDGRGFVFAGGGLYDLPISRSESEFALSGLSPPAALESEACEAQWRRFALGLHAPDHAEPRREPALPAAPSRDGGALQPSAAGSGCTLAPGRPRPIPSALVLASLVPAVFALRRRR